ATVVVPPLLLLPSSTSAPSASAPHTSFTSSFRPSSTSELSPSASPDRTQRIPPAKLSSSPPVELVTSDPTTGCMSESPDPLCRGDGAWSCTLAASASSSTSFRGILPDGGRNGNEIAEFINLGNSRVGNDFFFMNFLFQSCTNTGLNPV
ncbi:hypothetical protein L917_11311, partial [Phytophthora nicotianae]